MKRSIVFLAGLLFSVYLAGQTTVTIGTGSATQKQPFGIWASYERSASLYLSSEIGSFGLYGLLITSLGWETGTGDPTLCPVRIYLKTTTASNLTPISWTQMINGATLVYDATTSFPVSGWDTIDIADFVYTSGNLLVLCETNFGGSGASSYPVFTYSYFPGKHESWEEYDFPPQGPGSVDNNRPNIQITFHDLNNPVIPPSGFLATAISANAIQLTWKSNSNGDQVTIAMNQESIFGSPSGVLVVGDTLVGGGTVVYSGPASGWTHTGLLPAITYYYKAWSWHQQSQLFSDGVTSAAITHCSAINQFPYSQDFEGDVFPPDCWSLGGIPWKVSDSVSSFGAGEASVMAGFFSTVSGELNLVSPMLDFSSFSNPTVSFHHAYATYSHQVDKLEFWYSTNGGISYSLHTTWLGGLGGPLNTGGATTSFFVPTPEQWATKSILIPSGTNRVMFRGVSGYGNNLYLDSITFSGMCNSPSSLSASSITPVSALLGWYSAGTPASWNVLIGEEGFDPETDGTLVTGITTNSYTMTNLTANTGYDFYVRSDCSGSLSPWAGPENFYTTCESAGVPFVEEFDFFTPPMTGCFIVSDENFDLVTWRTSGDVSHSPANSILVNNDTMMGIDDWFFTPAITMQENVLYEIHFHYRSMDPNHQEKLSIEWGVTPEVSGMTEGELWNDTNIRTMNYIEAICQVSPTVTQDYVFGWHGFSNPGSGYLSVDDIFIEVAGVTWNGSVSDHWNEPANWTPEMVPGSGQGVSIPAGTPYEPNVSEQYAECRSLFIASGAGLTITSSADLTINENLVINDGAMLTNNGLLVIKGNLENYNDE